MNESPLKPSLSPAERLVYAAAFVQAFGEYNDVFTALDAAHKAVCAFARAKSDLERWVAQDVAPLDVLQTLAAFTRDP